MSWLLDPRLFPVLILILFGLAAIRYAFAGDWAQVAYHGGAFILNVAVLAMAK